MVRIPFPSISLAAKCRILFGLAVVLIIGAALTVPWLRMSDLVHAKNFHVARQMAIAAVHHYEQIPGDWRIRQRALDVWWAREAVAHGLPGPAPRVIPLDPMKPEAPAGFDEYVKESIRRLARQVGLEEAAPRVEPGRGGHGIYQVIRPIRSGGEDVPAGLLLGVVLATHIAPRTGADLSENLGLILMAGALAGILAVLVFYIISQRLILSPVRELRHVADEVAAGNHSVRSRIETGDEFEELARAFNSMLSHLQDKQEELRTINVSLDTRLGDLAERNVALFESNRVKSQFVANVSHELRTPLTSIIGFAELLREGGVDDVDRRRRYLQNILDSGRMLLGLINDLLDLAKMEAGKFTLHRGVVNLHDMIQNLISFMQPLADKKELALVADVGADMPEVVSDSGRIQQILYNLLSNAIKFSEPGGRVSTRIAREGDEHVVIVIEDTGIGIPEPQLADIFEKFRQLDGSMTREYGGAGLGLAITRELVLMLGGSISVRSEEGRGSEFRVLLPISAPETAVVTPISLS